MGQQNWRGEEVKLQPYKKVGEGTFSHTEDGQKEFQPVGWGGGMFEPANIPLFF